MSRAFVREAEGGEAFEALPDRPVSPHPNYVTRDGLAAIEGEVARLEAEARALDPTDTAGNARVARDLRYWTLRRGSAELVERTETAGDGTVQFGARVTLLRADDARQTFRIVGEDEADPARGTISYVAPLARALAGRQVGDEVEVNGQSYAIDAIDAG